MMIFKIMDLMNEYGPLGQTIYDVLLCMIYHEGYYLEVPSMEQLADKNNQNHPGTAG